MKKQTKIFTTGNEAMAEAAVQAGCMFYAGYPITPQNEITSYMSKRMAEVNRVFVQSESEVAAVNMVLGAAATGVRAMTSSSSPGISLKQEGLSYIAGCRLPCLIINVMRAGPGLGGIGPSQSDYFQAVKGGGHGDYHMIVLAPASVQEAYDLVIESFNLADTYRIPVMILADAIIGQMSEPMVLRKPRIVKVRKEWALTGAKGREANVVRSFSLKNEALFAHNLLLQKTYEDIHQREEKAESNNVEDCRILLCAYGSIARILQPLTEDPAVGLFRPVSLWPFPEKKLQAIVRDNRRLKAIYVVEASFGQMVEDVRLAVNGKVPVHFYGKAGGAIPKLEEVRQKIAALRKR